MPTEAGRHQPGAFRRSGSARKALSFASVPFSLFLPEGSASSWARDKQRPAGRSARPGGPPGVATVRPLRPLRGQAPWAGLGAQASGLPTALDRGRGCGFLGE